MYIDIMLKVAKSGPTFFLTIVKKKTHTFDARKTKFIP